ncbi:terpenoid synthase [Pisolithus thermaeus]|nr:terpenoid synthase [Pisolithus thermaeus]
MAGCRFSTVTWGFSMTWLAELQKLFCYITPCPSKICSQLMPDCISTCGCKSQQISMMPSHTHNDIEDDSDLRRGKPAAHKVYGIPQPTNSASYAWWLAFQQLASIQWSPKEKELLNLHHGQGLDIFWPDILRRLTEQEYIRMARGKGSSILWPSVKIMMAFATTSTDVDYVGLIDLFGIYGQIWDDYMNLQIAADIQHITNILRHRPKTPTLKHQAIAYLRDTTYSLDCTLSVMRYLGKQVREKTTELGGNPIQEMLLEGLHR